MRTLGNEIDKYEEELRECWKIQNEQFNALPQAEKNRIKKAHEDKVAAEMQPHRLDLSDDEDDESKE